jgi:DNA-binding beta-propeller fold protein YncE
MCVGRQRTSIVTSVPVGNSPEGAVFDPANGEVYVTNLNSANVSLIRGSAVVGSIPLAPDSYPTGAAFDPDNGYVYVVDDCAGGPGCVSVLNGTRIVASIPLGEGVLGAAFDPANECVYVTADVGFSTWVYVVNGTSYVAAVAISQGPADGGLPGGATFDSDNGYLYAAFEPDGLITNGGLVVLNGTTVVQSAALPVTGTDAVAFDPSDGLLYVTNQVLPDPTGFVSVVRASFYYPRIASFFVNPDDLEINSTTDATTNFQVTASGGAGPENFSYAGLPPGCQSSNSSTLPCTPTVSGAYTIRVSVSDSVGDLAQTAASIYVVAALNLTLTATTNRTHTGTSVAFSATPSGGIPPVTYSWRFGDGAASTAEDPTHSYASPGSYTAHVWANDSNGGMATGAVRVLVVGGPPPSLLALLNSPLLLIGLAVVLGAIVILALMIARRRRNRPGSGDDAIPGDRPPSVDRQPPAGP